MSLPMPVLETDRFFIRPFRMADLEAVYELFDCDLFPPGGDEGKDNALEIREAWLQWTVLGYEQRAQLDQPPYGERAVVQKVDGRLAGAVGFVPCLNTFGQLPFFQASSMPERTYSAEFGIYYAIASDCQGRGYATEAARAMVAYAFDPLNLKRVVATTTYDNAASQAVMRKLGMRIERNPFDNPPWLQVVGVLERSPDQG